MLLACDAGPDISSAHGLNALTTVESVFRYLRCVLSLTSLDYPLLDDFLDNFGAAYLPTLMSSEGDTLFGDLEVLLWQTPDILLMSS